MKVEDYFSDDFYDEEEFEMNGGLNLMELQESTIYEISSIFKSIVS
jgi:hypothetical protein